MSTNGSGKTQDLNQVGAQALQALLSSIAPRTGASDDTANAKLTPELVEKLSNKIAELVGDGNGGPEEQRSASGELVNEEGLPIIDITEPLAAVAPRDPPNPADEETLLPLAALPLRERERLRQERERVLDLLEEEEERELARAEQLEEEERRETLKKRREASKGELERLTAAKEMQKKMGKALLRNMAEAREREEKAKRELLEADAKADKKPTLKSKKSVTFADLPDDSGDEPSGSQDTAVADDIKIAADHVTPARLRARTRPTLVTKAEVKNHPIMKMEVVERRQQDSVEQEDDSQDLKDSDDETVPPDSPVPADSDEGEVIHSDREDDPHEERRIIHDSDEDEAPVLEDEFDLDLAQHQREIAMEYYTKRTTIGEETLKAMSSHSHDEIEGEDDWHQAEVPLEATLSEPHPKPAMSRFKSSRLASAYNATSSSQSLPSVLPASSTRTLQRAIRTGRLEGDKLVGGVAGESGSEDEDVAMREVLELLRRGEVHNIGPDGNLTKPQPAPAPPLKPPSRLAAPQPATPQPAPAVSGAPTAPATAPKTSKFKLARSQAGRPAAAPPTPVSPVTTPTSTSARSSPKLPGSPASSAVRERVPPSGLSRQPKPASMDVKSPSFARPPAAQFATIIDSPSFRPPAPIAPAIVTSPSFPPPQGQVSSRPSRPPVVMSSAVRESVRGTQAATVADGDEDPAPVKVSRFMAERM